MIMEALVESKCALSGLLKGYQSFPQVSVNVPVENKPEVMKKISGEVEKVRKSLGVRLIVRPSGTEPLIRIMAEGELYENCVGACGRIRELIENMRG